MTKIHSFIGNDQNLKWEQVREFLYEEKGLAGIKKYVLVGIEDTDQFEFRIFQFEHGSKSDFAKHDKEYVFFILEGTTRIQIDKTFYDLKPKDCIFIPKNQLIQIVNNGKNPLRFVCVISNH